MKVLWLTPKWTLPANDGARVASYQLLKNLPKDKMQIDYLAFSHPDDKENKEEIINELGLNEAYFVKRYLPNNLFEKLFYYLSAFLMSPLRPLTVNSFNSMPIKLFLNSLLAKNKYDYIVADGLHCVAPLYDKIKEQKIIYRAHNVEADIWLRASQSTKNILYKLFLILQYKVMKQYENNVLINSNQVFPISDDDKSVFQKITKKDMVVIPIGMNFDKKASLIERSKVNFLFLGRLDWPPNRDGLKWLLDNVYPSIDFSKSHLHIAGSGDRSWLKSYESLEGVTFHGYVDDISDLYNQIDCSLIPIFYGSGTRIKVIEACSYAKPIISSEMGALGSSLLPDIDYTRCEEAQEWVDVINNYNSSDHIQKANNAVQTLKNIYDEKIVAEKLYQSLS